MSRDIANPLNLQVHGQEGAAVTDSCRPAGRREFKTIYVSAPDRIGAFGIAVYA